MIQAGERVEPSSAVNTHQVDSMDYVLVIWRWKWIIALGTLACVLAACLVTWNAPRAYRIRAVVDLGDLSDDFGKDVERLIARINAQASLADRGGTAGSPAAGPLMVEFRKPSIIEVSATTETPAEAVRGVTRAADELVGELDRLMAMQLELYEATRRRADDLHAIVERLRAAQAATLRQADSVAGALVLARLTDDLIIKELRLSELELVRARERRQTRPRLLAPPEASRISIRRRLAINLAISLVVGLAGSLAFVLMAQHVWDARRQAAGGALARVPPDPGRP